jgi:hypothetical protein
MKPIYTTGYVADIEVTLTVMKTGDGVEKGMDLERQGDSGVHTSKQKPLVTGYTYYDIPEDIP